MHSLFDIRVQRPEVAPNEPQHNTVPRNAILPNGQKVAHPSLKLEFF
jgi:hypothetical protein